MGNIISALQDFFGVILLGGTIILFLRELKTETLKRYHKGSSKLTPHTQKLTGTKLDLIYDRVYGKQ